jgi:hypothetical protein
MVGLDLRVHTNTLAGYCIPTAHPKSKDQTEQLKEVKERLRERKGRGRISTSFSSFLTPQLILHLTVSIG